jgi:hypothetical protein
MFVSRLHASSCRLNQPNRAWRKDTDSPSFAATSGERRRYAMDSPALTVTGGEQRHEGCAYPLSDSDERRKKYL